MKKLLTILLLAGVLYGQTDTLTFKVNGLVCSFCAYGLTKGIGGLPFTDEKSIFVDIENQIVKVAQDDMKKGRKGGMKRKPYMGYKK